MDMFTLGEDVRLKASGGEAIILNPVNMEVLQNDVVADTWVILPVGAQIILTGMFNNDVYLITVSESGDFQSSENTYGLVVRRKSWQNILDVAAVS